MTENLKFPDQSEVAPVQAPMVYIRKKSTWEYKQIVRNLAVNEPLNEEELNALGDEGWEMTGVFADSPLAYYYFKRITE